MLTGLRDVDAIENDVTLTEKGCRKLFVTPVWSENSKSYPEADINIPRMYTLISKSMYVSLSAGIKNPRTF